MKKRLRRNESMSWPLMLSSAGRYSLMKERLRRNLNLEIRVFGQKGRKVFADEEAIETVKLSSASMVLSRPEGIR